MAKLVAHPKSFSEAQLALKGKQSRKLGNNTFLEDLPGLQFIGVRLHNTYIVRFHYNGKVTLHTDGWRTVTTKDRINEFVSGRVYQKNHVWFYVGHKADGSLNWESPVEFTEAMEVQ